MSGSYSQFGEDLEIAKFFPENYLGIYVDIGSGHPVEGSNTYYFYQQGWRGLCVDPVRMHCDIHGRKRSDDVIVQAIIADYTGTGVFYERPDEPTVSTTIHKFSSLNAVEYLLPVLTIASLIRLYPEFSESPDILSIDVEGGERAVLEGIPFEEGWLPKIVILESCLPCTEIPSYEEWEHILLSHNYIYNKTYGVNRVYVHERV